MKVTGVRYLREASADYEHVAFYEARQAGLGHRVVALAAHFPEAAASIKTTARRHRVRWIGTSSFPIKIVYSLREDVLIVAAIFHQRRRPGFWRDRLSKNAL